MSTGGFEYQHDGDWSKQSTAVRLTANPTLAVQATQDIINHNANTSWTRVQLRPASQSSKRLIDWVLSPWESCRNGNQSKRAWHFARLSIVLRLSIALIPLQLLLLLRGIYNNMLACDLPSPVSPLRQLNYTRNRLDRRQEETATTPETDGEMAGVVELFKSTRLVLPRRLVMYADKSWILVKDPAPTTEYLFISWHWESFKYDKNKPRREALSFVKKMARHATLEAGLKAYWLDVQCVADESSGDSFTSDNYGMADIVRNAYHVAVLLPSEHSFYKRAWARRLWTLPEGLLSKGRLQIWTATETGFTKNEFDRVEMTYEFWRPFENDERHYPTRILAEYFEHQIELSRLELIVTAIAALSRQDSSNFTQADIAYALMGLLSRRLIVNKDDTLHQAMTKLLSLTGENEYLIERMISSFPHPAKDFRVMLKALLSKDQFGTCLWDIRPHCEVVGVDDIDGVVYLSNCRTLPIYHQSLPDRTDDLFRKIRPFLKAAVLLLVLLSYGFLHMFTQTASVIYVTWFCTLLLCFQNMRVEDVASHKHDLVLLEGTLPLSQLEDLVSGTLDNILTYDASSSPLNARHHANSPAWVQPLNIRRWEKELYTARASGNEPEWIRPTKAGLTPASPTSPISPLLRRTSTRLEPLQEAYFPPLHSEHTLFTLIQTSTGQISLIQARLPPTTLLLTGEEGGMLRGVLCSSLFNQDGHEILQKEAVVRLNPDLWAWGNPRSWLRVKML